MTLEELRALLDREGLHDSTAHLVDELEDTSVEVLSTTSIEGDFIGHAPMTVVQGDLTVRGVIQIDGPAPRALIVLGSVRCRALVARGALVVRDAVHAESFVYVCSGNDFLCEVGGELTAKAFIENGTVSFAKKLNARVFRQMNSVSEAGREFERTTPEDLEAFLNQGGLLPEDVERYRSL